MTVQRLAAITVDFMTRLGSQGAQGAEGTPGSATSQAAAAAALAVPEGQPEKVTTVLGATQVAICYFLTAQAL
jgi:hypothetical protein